MPESNAATVEAQTRYVVEMNAFDQIGIQISMPARVWNSSERERLIEAVAEAVCKFEETRPDALA